MNRRSTHARLQALEKQYPKPERSYHIYTMLAKLELVDQPDMILVQREDTDAETFHRIRETVERAHGNHAEADRLEDILARQGPDPSQPRRGETPMDVFVRIAGHSADDSLSRQHAAQEAAISAARARLAREAAAVPPRAAPLKSAASTKRPNPHKQPIPQIA